MGTFSIAQISSRVLTITCSGSHQTEHESVCRERSCIVDASDTRGMSNVRALLWNRHMHVWLPRNNAKEACPHVRTRHCRRGRSPIRKIKSCMCAHLLLTGDLLRLTLRLAARRGDLERLCEYERSLHTQDGLISLIIYSKQLLLSEGAPCRSSKAVWPSWSAVCTCEHALDAPSKAYL